MHSRVVQTMDSSVQLNTLSVIENVHVGAECIGKRSVVKIVCVINSLNLRSHPYRYRGFSPNAHFFPTLLSHKLLNDFDRLVCSCVN